MNHAADEHDEARPGLGDDFLSAVVSAFSLVFAAPQRWPLVDARHSRFVLPVSDGEAGRGCHASPNFVACR